jgi:predicted nucleic acid-binding Zn ribbon protein
MPRKTKLDASWRQAAMRKCEAPKEVGKAPRCGKPFPAYGVKKTCSPECSEKLWLEWKRDDYKAKAPKILAQQKQVRDRPDPARPRTLPRPCANRDCPHGENGQPKIFVNRKGALCCSDECLDAYRKAQAQQYYRDNSEKWERSNAKRTERERAERIPTIRSCVVCGEKFVVKHPTTRSITCSPECRNARTRHMERVRYAADIETSRG